MANCTHIKQLSPLDLTVPTAYINILFAFDTTEPTPTVREHLKIGLDALSKQLPWLSGRVFANRSQGKPSLEIRYNADTALTILDKGSIDGAYESLSAQGVAPEAIPPEVWPLPPVIDDAMAAAGAPVFATIYSVSQIMASGYVSACTTIPSTQLDSQRSSNSGPEALPSPVWTSRVQRSLVELNGYQTHCHLS